MVVRLSHFTFSALEKKQINTLNETKIYMTNSNEHKTISPEFKQLLRDIISDILSNGQSSRLYINLIKNGKLFSEIDAYITGDMDPGLFVFSGKLSEGVAIEEAEAAIQNEINHFIEDPISERELQKVINKTDARISYSEINYQGKSANLAFFEYLGNIDLINSESARYAQVSLDSIKRTARELFAPENCSTLWYLKDK